MVKKLLLASCGAIALGACAGGNRGSNSLYENSAIPYGQMTSAPFVIDKSPLNQIDLINLIDPENRRVRLAGEGLCGAHNVFGKQNGTNDISANGAARSIPELRDQYLYLQYAQILGKLLALTNPANKEGALSDDDIRKKRDGLLAEKSDIEKEAKEIGANLGDGAKLNPAIELNCATYAFYTYYLSFPQFEFAIHDLSWVFDEDYVNRLKNDGGPLSILTQDSSGAIIVGEEWEIVDKDKDGRPVLQRRRHDKNTIESREKYISDLSEYQQARLRAYFASGLYEKFYEEAIKSVALAMRRNAIQDQVMVHSENYCRFFKTQLHDTDIKVNLTAGIASTVLGGLATIFTDPTTVRALAGSAAIVSGSQNKYNEVMFANLAVQTVIAGIDLSRERILREINENRFFPLSKDDIDEFKSLDNGGVLNPGMFNTYGLRASIEWGNLYGEEDGKLTYAGGKVIETQDKLGNLTFQPPIFTFSDLIARTSLQKETSADPANATEEQTTTEEAGTADSAKLSDAQPNLPPIAVGDDAETKEDNPVIIDVLKNDTDPNPGDKEKLKIKKADAQSGTIALIEDNTKLKYTPNPNFHGKDFIRYWITDQKKVEDKETLVKGFVDVTVVADGEDPPAKKYLGLASVGVYSVESSLRDAIRFQTACSLASGLTEATKAMEQARAPSVETLTRSLKQMEEMMKATESLRRAIDRAATTDKSPPPQSGGKSTDSKASK